MKNTSAEIVEIFSSLQGEGPYTGEPTTFVRFGLCTMKCRYCDTPEGLCHREMCRIESPPKSEVFTEILNPVDMPTLCKELKPFVDRTLSITGGEPLEQAEFLAEWLPFEAQRQRILLETNGVHYEALGKIAPFIHAISMDIKLPTSSGIPAMWKEHEHFLKIAIATGKEVYVKIVVTEDTTDGDVQTAIDMLTRTNKFVLVIIQPALPTLTFHHPISMERLRSIQRICCAYLPNVSVMEQMHKEMGVL